MGIDVHAYVSSKEGIIRRCNGNMILTCSALSNAAAACCYRGCLSSQQQRPSRHMPMQLGLLWIHLLVRHGLDGLVHTYVGRVGGCGAVAGAGAPTPTLHCCSGCMPGQCERCAKLPMQQWYVHRLTCRKCEDISKKSFRPY
jgi:hypothetical protein